VNGPRGDWGQEFTTDKPFSHSEKIYLSSFVVAIHEGYCCTLCTCLWMWLEYDGTLAVHVGN
jgi:hypothetical protein